MKLLYLSLTILFFTSNIFFYQNNNISSSIMSSLMSHPQDKLYKITTLVDKYSSRFPETPFLAHLDYFANNDNITTDSIATKMSKLTGDYYIVSRLKAGVVIKAANQNLQKGECPYYKDSFKSEE